MKRRWIGTIGLVCLLAAGCAVEHRETGNPDQAVQSVRAGAPLLRCREPCLAEWRVAQSKAPGLIAAGRWRDLVALLAGVGYQDDLTLFYLAEAAQGLGSPAAAEGYYRQSIWLSDTAMACARLSRQCGGLGLPQAARVRLAALDRPLPRPSRASPSMVVAPAIPASIVPAPGPASPPEPGPEAATAPVLPAEPAVLAPLPPPPSPPREAAAPVPPPREAARPKPGEDYIEPPPAAR